MLSLVCLTKLNGLYFGTATIQKVPLIMLVDIEHATNFETYAGACGRFDERLLSSNFRCLLLRLVS